MLSETERASNISKAKQRWERKGQKWWESQDAKVRAHGQLQEDILLMPFGQFHEDVEKLMGRPVWTHEFAHPDELLEELKSGKKIGIDGVLEKAANFGLPVIALIKPDGKETDVI